MLGAIKRLIAISLSVVFVLPISVLTPGLNLTARNSSKFDVTAIDPELTLSEAIEQYPEILDVFYIIPLSDEEAEHMVSEGVRVFCLEEDISAVSILSSLNARKSYSDPK